MALVHGQRVDSLCKQSPQFVSTKRQMNLTYGEGQTNINMQQLLVGEVD